MATPIFPTHLTLSPEERAQLGLPEPGATTSSRSRLLKRHEFRIIYPDGMEGTCQYERFGPTYHSFHFRYGTGNLGQSTPLPRQFLDQTLGNTPQAIEAAGRETAQAAFASAIRRERIALEPTAMPGTNRYSASPMSWRSLRCRRVACSDLSRSAASCGVDRNRDSAISLSASTLGGVKPCPDVLGATLPAMSSHPRSPGSCPGTLSAVG